MVSFIPHLVIIFILFKKAQTECKLVQTAEKMNYHSKEKQSVFK